MLRHDGTLVYYQLYEATSKKSLSPSHFLAFSFAILTELDSSPSSRSTTKQNSSQFPGMVLAASSDTSYCLLND